MHFRPDDEVYKALCRNSSDFYDFSLEESLGSFRFLLLDQLFHYCHILDQQVDTRRIIPLLIGLHAYNLQRYLV